MYKEWRFISFKAKKLLRVQNEVFYFDFCFNFGDTRSDF